VQVTAEDELADLFCACLPELDEIEAAFIEDCCLREPKMQLRDFSKRWGLSAKALSELRERAMLRLKDLMAKRAISSIADII
jgi:hypothetical protein